MLTAAPANADVAAAAADLGVAPYDVRQWCAGVLPRLVLLTDDRALAIERVRALVAHRFAALAIDAGEIVPTSRMVEIRRFSFDDEALTASDDRPERLAFADIDAVVEAAHRSDVERHTFELEPGARHVMRNEPTSVREVVTRESATARSMYLFPRAGTPWVLHEARARYLGLGARMRPTQRENLNAFRALVRERAPFAAFDDRFALRPLHGTEVTRVVGSETARARESERVDVLVTALARHLTRPTGGAYRASRR